MSVSFFYVNSFLGLHACLDCGIKCSIVVACLINLSVIICGCIVLSDFSGYVQFCR